MYKGININGTVSMYVYDNVVDFDFSALYPSIRDSHNIEITSQWGRLIIGQQISDLENPYDYDKYDRGGNFLDDLQINEPILLCHKWLGLPTAEKILSDLEEELKDELVEFKDEVAVTSKGMNLKVSCNVPKGFILRIIEDPSKWRKGLDLTLKEKAKGFSLKLGEKGE